MKKICLSQSHKEANFNAGIPSSLCGKMRGEGEVFFPQQNLLYSKEKWDV